MNDPVLIVFVALAAFLSYKLFTVLGSRDGHEPNENDQQVPSPLRAPPESKAEPNEEQQIDRLHEPLPDWAQEIVKHYPGFEPDRFLEGAKSAYEMIVQNFARGDLDRIRPYIAPDVLKAFEIAVEGRRHAGQTMEVSLVGIEKVEVVSSEQRSNHLEVTVAFRSDQIRVVRDAEGEVIDGDPNRIDLVRDRWTFSRPLDSRDPNWILVATDGA